MIILPLIGKPGPPRRTLTRELSAGIASIGICGSAAGYTRSGSACSPRHRHDDEDSLDDTVFEYSDEVSSLADSDSEFSLASDSSDDDAPLFEAE